MNRGRRDRDRMVVGLKTKRRQNFT